MLKTSITVPFLLLLINGLCGTTPVTVGASATPNYFNNLQKTFTNLERSIAENKTKPPISQLLDELWLTVEQLWKQKPTSMSNSQNLQLPQDNRVQSTVHLVSQAYSAQVLSQDGELSTVLRSRSSENGVTDAIYKVTPQKVTGDSRLVLSVVDMTFKAGVWDENDQSEYSIVSPVLEYFWTISGETFGHSSHSVQFNRQGFEKDANDKELLCLVWNTQSEKWETFKHFRLSNVDQEWVNCESYDPSEKSKPMAVGYRRETETQNSPLFGSSGVSEDIAEVQVESLNVQSSPQMAAALIQEKPTEATASNPKPVNVNCLGRVPRRDLPTNGPMFTIIKQQMTKSISEEASLITDINDLELKTLRYELGQHSEVFGAKIAASSFNHNVGEEGLIFPALTGGVKQPNLRMSRDFLKQFMYLKNLEIGMCITDREATDFSKSLDNSESVASSIVTVTFIAPQDSLSVSPLNPPIEIEIPLTKSQRVHNPQCYSLDRFNTLQNSNCQARLEEGSLICRCSGVASFVVVDTPLRVELDADASDATTPLMKSVRIGNHGDDVRAMQRVSYPENKDDHDQPLYSFILLSCCVVVFAVFLGTFVVKHRDSFSMHLEQRFYSSCLSGHCYANILFMSLAAVVILVAASTNVGPLNGKFAEALASLIIISIGGCLVIWKLILQDSFPKNPYMAYAGIYLPVIASFLGAVCLVFKEATKDEKVLADVLGDVVVYSWTAVLGAISILDFCVGWSQRGQSINYINNRLQRNAEPDAASASGETASCSSEGVVAKTSTRVLFVVTAVLVALSCVLTCVNRKTSNSLEVAIVAILFATCVSGYFLFRSVLGLTTMCRNPSIASWNWCMDNRGISDDCNEKKKIAGSKVNLDHGDVATASGESLHDDENVDAAEEAVESYNGFGLTTQTHV